MTPTAPQPGRIVLVIDDEPQIRRLLRVTLEANGYQVIEAVNGQEGIVQAAQGRPEIILLDLGLPDLDGVEVLKRIREWSRTPVLILSVRDREHDKVAALDAGADDFVTKPFSSGELLARLRALLRRPNQLRSPQIVVGDLTIDTASQTARRGSRTISLTAKEYALLEFLARNAGRVVGRSEIAEHVWDETFDPFSNLIEVYVNRLRRKLGDDDKKPLLQTRRGSGYILGAPSDSRSSAPARAGGASNPSRKSHA